MNTHDHSNKTGIFDGIEYRIWFHRLDIRPDQPEGSMSFYCAYVKVPEDHPWIKSLDAKKWFDIRLQSWNLHKSVAKREGKPFTEEKPKSHRHYFTRYDDIDVDVHGGLTFGKKIHGNELKFYKRYQNFSEGYWIGWDYGHSGDYNHSAEWHSRLLSSNDPQTQKLGKDLLEIDKRLAEYIKDSPLSWQEKDWELEEVENECINVIGQLRRAYVTN